VVRTLKAFSLQLSTSNSLAQTQNAIVCESKAFSGTQSWEGLAHNHCTSKKGGQSKIALKQHSSTLEKQYLGKSVPAHIQYIKTIARLSSSYQQIF